MGEQLNPDRKIVGTAKLVAAALLLLRVGGFAPDLLPSGAISLSVLILLLVYERISDAFADRGRGTVLHEWGAWARDHWFVLGLAVITLIALALRMFGIARDLGHVPLDIDENRLNASVLHLFRTGDIDYETVEHYPGIHYWTLVGTYVVAYLWGLMSDVATALGRMPAEHFVAFGRSISAIQSTATVLLTGLLGRRLAGPRSGLAAAGVLALAPLSVVVGRQLRNDAAETLLLVAAIYLALAVYRRDHKNYEAVLAGAMVGLAAGVKYTGVLVLIPVVLAAATTENSRRRWRALGLVIVGFLATALLSNHFVWADLPNFVLQMSDQILITGEGHWAAQANPAAYHARILAERVVGWPLLLLGAAAAAYYLASSSWRWWIFSLFPLIYILFVGQRPSQLPRWVYPSAPFVAVAAGVGLVAVIDFATRRFASGDRRDALRPVLAATLMVALSWPLLSAATLDVTRRLSAPTWALAEQWVRENAAPGDRILLQHGMLEFDRQRYDLNRQSPLVAVIEGGRYELAANDWIVVHEGLLGNDALAAFDAAHRVRLDYTFFGNQGPDFAVFRPPEARPAQLPLEVSLAEPSSRNYLGHRWLSESRRRGDGRHLPDGGANLFLPPLGRGDLRLDLFVETTVADTVPTGLEIYAGDQRLEARVSRETDTGPHTYTLDLPISIVGPHVVTLGLQPSGDGSPLRIAGFRLYAADDR